MKTMMFAALLALASAGCARHDHQRLGDLEVSVAWARATPPGAPVAGGFLTVRNRGAADERLVAVESEAAQSVEIHEVRHEGEVARMRRMEAGLPVPAGQTVVLEPGGYHLMFIRPAKAFEAGERVAATLVFEKAGPLPVEFEVRPLGTTQPEAAHHHH
ncbi:hypothetical protein B1992_04430 [Pseudoxanthomonas broegbernensis]|uniref:Copper chaperone PCu(A)C n=1 Tax=Pseudoxanthomonas broegbernensis TaxID=83619 RepID=A0A7V8K807_9GAMM|nr:copper chaperone PCu(A)C [Pseudoxanthomonas broegbernensis]KAF1687235.1 hypothetical protein B1992_04430 [Pseudoxanthomonas broegbernensis]MBB6065776.1 hypothetical protein [Pseudoxanthomonas broegbernensis]